MGSRPIPIYVDLVGLKEMGISTDSSIQIEMDASVPLQTSLWLALHQLDLGYTVKGGVLIISSQQRLTDIEFNLPPLDPNVKPGYQVFR